MDAPLRPPLTDGFAGPLRWIGAGLLVVAALIAAIGTAFAIGEGTYDFGYLIGVAVFAALGGGLRYVAGRLQRGEGFDLPTVVGAVFGVFGLAIVAVGIGLTVDDPAGLFVIGFGLVFVGVGYLAWRLFRTPPGMKAVAVSSLTVGGRSQTTLIHVDADASEAEVEAARAGWTAEQLAARPDWAAGRIAADEARGRNVMFYAAGLWAVLAVGLGAAAWFAADDFFWFAAAIAGLGAIGLAVGGIVRRRRLAKFGASHLVLAALPARLGATLEGRVESGIGPRAAPAGGFTVTLRCVHRYERTVRTGDNRRTERHRDVLWQAETQAEGRHVARHPGLVVPVAFDVPADQPASTLGGGDGILWELAISAAVPGLDYAATFELPVLAPEATPPARSPAPAPPPPQG